MRSLSAGMHGDHAKLAADFAREASPPEPSIARTVPAPQQRTPFNGPRGFANPIIQQAAQEGRRLKGLT